MKDFFRKYRDRIATAGQDDCWPWTGSHTSSGYGNLTRYNRSLYAHRSAFEAANPGIVTRVVRHSCDNPPCVNPRHLLAGTHADNHKDAKDRGRLRPAKGGDINTAVLTAADVKKARMAFAKGNVSISALARKFGVCHNGMSAALTGESWAHLPGAKPPPGMQKGMQRWNAKLTDQRVAEIKAAIAAGERGCSIAARLGVDSGSVSAIKMGRAWKHV